MLRFVKLNHKQHRDLCYSRLNDFSFARHISQIELVITEIWSLASEFPTVFMGSPDGSVTPIAVIGRPGVPNTTVNNDGQWLHRTLPSLLQIYPFALETTDESSMRVLIDESSFSFTQNGANRLFEPDGSPSDALRGLMALFQSIHAALGEARELGRVAQKLGVLSTPAEYEAAQLDNAEYFIVDVNKLENLKPAGTILLRQKKWLPLLYAMALSTQVDLESRHPLFWTRTE